MIKLVLLDFDDTLCLSEESCFHFENEIAQSMGFKPMTREIHKATWGQHLNEAILSRIPGVDSKEFMKRFDEMVPEAITKGKFDYVPKENLKVLEQIKDDGKKIAIITSRTFVEVRLLMDSTHPLSGKIDKFYYKESVEHMKPDPRVFNKALYEFDVMPIECVYVGDTLKDGFAANNSGMDFIAVLESGLVSKETFKNVNIHVDFFAKKFTDILPYVLQN
ncbi:MAG: HAD-IA family hydrolase [Candidatus Roizmanbacteria bacterium]|nr:HAD-IA family hydrolase [Candidatus Roizmanbacteria bacterium]